MGSHVFNRCTGLKEVTFEKDGDSWVKSDETGFPVDQDKIDTLVSALNSIKAERTLENVEDASEYELDQPENTITVTTEDGETTVIQLGMENDSTSQEYIDLNEDSSTVYVVSNSTFSSFKGTLYDFAKSGVFPNCGFLYGQQSFCRRKRFFLCCRER